MSDSKKLDKDCAKLYKELNKFGKEKNPSVAEAENFKKRINDQLTRVELELIKDPDNERLQNRRDQLVILQSITNNLTKNSAIDQIAFTLMKAFVKIIKSEDYLYPYDTTSAFTHIERMGSLGFKSRDEQQIIHKEAPYRKSEIYRSMINKLNEQKEQRIEETITKAKKIYQEIENAKVGDVPSLIYKLKALRIIMQELAGSSYDPKHQLELMKLNTLCNIGIAVENVSDKTSIIGSPDKARMEVYADLQKIAKEFKKDALDEEIHNNVKAALEHAKSVHEANPARGSALTAVGHTMALTVGALWSCTVIGIFLGGPLMVGYASDRLFSPYTKKAAEKLSSSLEEATIVTEKHVPLSKESLAKVEEEEELYQEFKRNQMKK